MSRRITDTQLKELKKCRSDYGYTIQKYGYIKTNKGTVKWRKPYPYQIELWSKLQEGLNVIVNKTRQIGCSWAIAAYAVCMMIFVPDIEILFLSETERKAIRLLNIAKFFLLRLPKWMRPEIVTNSQTRLAVRFTTRVDGDLIVSESSIDSLTTTTRSGASYTAKFVVMDEMGHCPNGEEAFSAIAPSIAHGGQFAGLSTPNGYGNVHARLWLEAKRNPDSGFYPILAHWRDQGLSEEWFRKATAGMTIQQILQEFECQFLSAGAPFFDLEQLKACYMPKDEYPEIMDARGNIISRKTSVCYTGVDVAGGEKLKSGKPPDYTSIVTLNSFGVQIDAWHSNTTAVPEVAGYVTQLPSGDRVEIDGVITEWHYKYPGAMVIERWGPGETVFLNHYMKYPDDEVSYVVPRRTTGGQHSIASKIRMLNNLRLGIAGRSTIITDEFTYQCMESFEDKGAGKYEAAEGQNDDPVIAYALAYDELSRNGGFVLEETDLDTKNVRMIGMRRKDDLPMNQLEDVLPVGLLVEGPMLEEAGVDRMIDEFEHDEDLY